MSEKGTTGSHYAKKQLHYLQIKLKGRFLWFRRRNLFPFLALFGAQTTSSEISLFQDIDVVCEYSNLQISPRGTFNSRDNQII